MSYLTKLGRLSSLITLAACGAVLPAIKSDIALAGPTSPSTFQTSCQNIKVVSDGGVLTANCRRSNGTLKSTSLSLNGIDNQDGNLAYGPRSTTGASYRSSCQNININGANLSASCRRANGTFKSTSILLLGIDNINGNLTYSR